MNQPETAQQQNCPYCGFDFDVVAEYCSGACPLAENCSMVMCPNCRYEFVPARSKTVDFFRKLFTRSESSKSNSPAESETHV